MTDFQALIDQALEKCQLNDSVHPAVVRELHKAHKKNPPKFRRAFVDECNQVLLILKREPTVERLIRFLVAFATGHHIKDVSSTELVQEFTDFFLKYLLALVVVREKAVRFRCCQLISGIVEAFSKQEQVELG
jgi:condensin complex subunit 3